MAEYLASYKLPEEESLLFDYSSDMMCIAGFDGYFKRVSSSFTRVLGWSKEELCARAFVRFVHPDDREAVARNLRFHAESRETVRFEARCLCKDGAYRWISWDASPLPDKRLIIAVGRDITERRDTDMKYSRILETALDGFWIADMKGKFLEVNDAFCRMSGYARHELLSMSIADVEAVESPAEIVRHIAAVRERQGELFMSRQRRKDGSLIDVALRATHLDIDEGQIVVFCEDITERNRMEEVLRTSRDELEARVEQRTKTLKKANDELKVEIERRRRTEEALRQAEEKYRNIFENAMDGIFQSAPDGRLLRVNPAFAKIFGYESSEEIQTAITNVGNQLYADPSDRLRMIEVIERQGYAEDYELQLRRKDGAPIWLSFNGQAVRNDGGDVLCYEGVVRDITERKKAGEERKLLVAAIERAAEGIYVLDADGVVEYANRAYCAMVGYTQEELVGKRIDITHREPIAQSLDDLREDLEAGKTCSMMLPKRRKDGTFFDERATIAAIKGDAGTITHCVCVGSDVTEQIAVEERRHQARKMEAIGTLAGGIAHDFNNMLSVIMGNAELALDDVHEEAPRHNLEKILKASKRSKDLVKQILTFSRKAGEQKELVNVAPVLKETYGLLRASLPSTIHMELVVEVEEDAAILAGPSQAQQAVLNLASNAAHAMQEKGGKLVVRLSHAVASDFQPAKSAPYLKLTVEDTGVGISPEMRGRIFEPFFTTKEAGHGTGMGLAVVHGIVEGFGGTIRVESEPGKGTTFAVFIPYAGVHPGKRRKKRPFTRGRNAFSSLTTNQPSWK